MKTNGNAETAGIEKPRQHNFLRLWGGLVQRTFPFMEEEVGELGPKARLFVTVCETVVKPETFKYAKWKGVGRPPAKRMPVFKAFLFKAVHGGADDARDALLSGTPGNGHESDDDSGGPPALPCRDTEPVRSRRPK